MAILFLIVFVAVLWCVCAFMIRPLDQAAKTRRRPTQFTIVDFLCLFVLIQIPTALIHSLSMDDTERHHLRFILDGYAWLSCGLVWWKCVQIMSRAGIQRQLHRVTLLLFVLPLTMACMVATFAVLIAGVAAVTQLDAALLGIAMSIAIGAAAGLFLSAHLVRRIVAASESATEVPVEAVIAEAPVETVIEPTGEADKAS